MFPQFYSFRVDKPSRSDFTIQFGTLLTKKITIISFNKADFHTFSFFRLCFISFLRKILTNLYFRIISQRENATFQHILPQSPEKIRLIFLIIVSGYYINVSVFLFQSRIMSGSYPCTIQLIRPLRQNTELKQRIAHHTRIRCTPLLIFIYEVFYDGLFKRNTLICHIMFNPHPFC